MIGSPVRRIAAPAKINLALHVVGRREDGFHLLDGLVAFTAFGDELSVRPARHDALTVGGRFGRHVPGTGDNLVLRALELARRIAAETDRALGSFELHLEKHLPVASGIGGGSADAAALLHHLATERPDLRGRIADEAGVLGADVPMCLACRPARTRGIGERLDAVPLPPLDIVLVNPCIAVSTPAVFGRLAQRTNEGLSELPDEGFTNAASALAFLAKCRNDLEAPALDVEPAIGRVRDALEASGASLVRMSGSGATVFGLYETPDAAVDASTRLKRDHPGWWSVATRTISARPEDHDDR